MQSVKKFFFLSVLLGVTFLTTASPVNAAQLTPQEQQQLAALSVKLSDISKALNYLKNNLFGTAQAQTAGTWTQLTGENARTSNTYGDTDTKPGHFQIHNGVIYALGGNGLIYKWAGGTFPSGQWDEVTTTYLGVYDDFFIAADGAINALRGNGAVYRWDGGGNWTQLTGENARTSNTYGDTDTKPGHFQIHNGVIYALGGNGLIYKWAGGTFPSGQWDEVTTTYLGVYDDFFIAADGAINALRGNGAVYRWDGAAAGPFTLTVTKEGTGSGTVTGAVINCGSACWATFVSGTSVTLTATSTSGSTFVGWGGDCTGTATTSTCALTMNSAKNVTATFDLVTSGISVTSGSPCNTSFPNDKFHVCYFDGIIFSGQALIQADGQTLSSASVPVRAATAFDNSWGTGTVGGTAKSDTVSAVWRGRINFDAGAYAFHTLSDDGVELTVEGVNNGNSIINDLSVHASKQDNYTATFSAAGYRNVTLKWFEDTGAAVIKLWWDWTAGGGDTAPPVRSNGFPTGTLSAGTTQTPLQLATNKNAICKYGVTPNQAYANKPFTFSPGNTTSHSVTVTGLTNGSTHAFYVRCQDTVSPPNVNTDDYTISFSVATSGGDANTPPFGFIDIPAGNATVSGTITVDGWMVDKEDNSLPLVELNVDGNAVPIGSVVRYNRSDVCASSGVQQQLGLTESQCNAQKQPVGVRFGWGTTTLSNGSHLIALKTGDSGGLSARIGERTVTVTGGGTTAPPVRSNGFPTGILPAGTTQTPLQLATNENAICKYGVTPNQAYANKPFTFSPGNTTSHSVTVTGLTNGSTHAFYVRCQDTVSPPNVNTDDYTISFSVATSGGGGGNDNSIDKQLNDNDPVAVVTSRLSVRSAPSLTAPFVNATQKTQQGGNKGAIRCNLRNQTLHPHCPLIQNGIVWWYVDYASGPDGWSAERWLNPFTGDEEPLLQKDTGTVGAETFVPNDRIEVTAAGSGLLIRTSPAREENNARGNLSTGKKGTVLSAPSGYTYPYQAEGYSWWFIRWDDATNCSGGLAVCEGWTAQGGTTAAPWLKKITDGGGGDLTLIYSKTLNGQSATDFKVNEDIYGKAQNVRANSMLCSEVLAHPTVPSAVNPALCANHPQNYVRMDSLREWKSPQGSFDSATNLWRGLTKWQDFTSIIAAGVNLKIHLYDPDTTRRTSAIVNYIADTGGGGGDGAVQLFMDPDGPGSAPPQIGTVQSKFRGDGGLNAAAFLRRAIIGNAGAILPSAMVADLSWDSSASSCTLLEEVNFPGLSTWPVYSGGDYFSPVTFRFPNVPGIVSASNSMKAVIPIRYADTAGTLVDSPYETKFTLECGGARSNTITAMFAPADIRKSDADFTNPTYGGMIAYPYMMTGPVIGADIKAATSNPPVQFSDTNGVSCMNVGGGTSLSCNLMVLWSSLNATECTISGLAYSSAYDWGVTAAFGYQNTPEVYGGQTTKRLTCRNSTETSTSDSVTVPFP